MLQERDDAEASERRERPAGPRGPRERRRRGDASPRPRFNSATLERHGLTADEYARIVTLVGREPNLTELGLFSVMWSEHCSYKSSRVHLRRCRPRDRASCRAPAKMPARSTSATASPRCSRSNRTTTRHSSSRTRARRRASAASFATSSRWARGRSRCSTRCDSDRSRTPRTRRIVAGVVSGIGGYGNSIGIPTVGGEVMFDEAYSGNPLVNVFCLGIARHDDIVKGAGERHRQPGVLRRRQDGPRRHSRRDDGVGGVRREVGGEAPGRAGGRSVHGEAAARGVPRGDGDRCVRRRAGHGRRGTDVLDVARPDRAAASASRSTSRSCRSARPA